MKQMERNSIEGHTKSPETAIRTGEKARETISQAHQTLAKADALLGQRPPRTSAEQVLNARRLRLTTWMKRFSLIGALAAGAAGVRVGAEHMGDAAQGVAERTGHAIRGLGDMQPIRIDLGGSAEEVEAIPAPLPEMVVDPSSEMPLAITINDSDGSSEADATVHEESYFDREQRQAEILRESALLIADELQAEGFFEHDQTASGFNAAVEARLLALNITGAGPLETAQRTIIERYKGIVRDQAGHDIEGALRMARTVNSAFGGIDTYALALEHHRPDLAAETASRTLSSYRENVHDIRADAEHTYEDPEEQTDALNRTRREMVRDIFSESHATEVPEVLRHLDREERRGLATALDAEIASLETDVASSDNPSLREEQRRQLEQLQSGRRDL